jgi:hypothetical protein
MYKSPNSIREQKGWKLLILLHWLFVWFWKYVLFRQGHPECLHCKMEQCLGQCWMFTMYDGTMPRSVLNVYIVRWKGASVSVECVHCMMEQCLGQCWMLTLYDGTMPRSVLNVYIVWWNNASVSAECLHCIMEQCLAQYWMLSLHCTMEPCRLLTLHRTMEQSFWCISLTSKCRNMYFCMLASWLLIHDTDNCEQWETKHYTIYKTNVFSVLNKSSLFSQN